MEPEMVKIHKIMVPVAFSRHSADLIIYAASLAKDLGAEMIMANVINVRDVEMLQKISSYGYTIDEEQYVKDLEKERLAELRTVLEKIDFPDDRISFIFRVGRPTKTLLKLALQENVDMIVMGIRDRDDFIHSLTGSVAEKIFRRSPITVVSFRDEKNAGHLLKRLED